MSVTLKISHPDGESGLLKIGSEFVLRVVYMIGEWNINEPIDIRGPFDVVALHQNRHALSTQPRQHHSKFQHNVLSRPRAQISSFITLATFVVGGKKHTGEIGSGQLFQLLDKCISTARNVLQNDWL